MDLHLILLSLIYMQWEKKHIFCNKIKICTKEKKERRTPITKVYMVGGRTIAKLN